jgi:hypothetical protein
VSDGAHGAEKLPSLVEPRAARQRLYSQREGCGRGLEGVLAGAIPAMQLPKGSAKGQHVLAASEDMIKGQQSSIW